MYRIVFIISLVIISAHTVLGLSGSGTQEDPWLIQSLEDFNDFAADANYWDDYTRLETDVNLAGLSYTTAVIAPDIDDIHEFFDGTAFTGVFDGNDHKIKNLTIDGGTNDILGLFGCIDNGEVMNLGLEGGFVSGDWAIGGLAGLNSGSISNCYSTSFVSGIRGYVGGLLGKNNGSVSNCYSTGDVNGTGGYIGGLVGYNGENISNCYSTGSISGDEYVGGITGVHWGLHMLNCYSTGDVSGGNFVGGLVGNSFYGSISSGCYSTSSVSGSLCIGGIVGENLGILLNCNFTGSIIGMNEVGGLVGYNLGRISNCYTSCFVDGPVDAGGLVGINSRNVLNCYSTGYVSGYENTGGLVGKNIDGSIWNCYSTGEVSGDWFAGGLVGYNVQPRWGNGIGVSNCYSTGDVDGIYCIGGLVGINGQEVPPLGQEPGYIHNSYSTGTVNGFSGGLVAIHVLGDIEGSFWDTETSGKLESAGGTGKTTADMKKESTFTDAGWDFEEVWDIGENQTYPYLRQYLSSDLNHDGSVNMVDFAILAGHWLEGVGG